MWFKSLSFDLFATEISVSVQKRNQFFLEANCCILNPFLHSRIALQLPKFHTILVPVSERISFCSTLIFLLQTFRVPFAALTINKRCVALIRKFENTMILWKIDEEDQKQQWYDFDHIFILEIIMFWWNISSMVLPWTPTFDTHCTKLVVSDAQLVSLLDLPLEVLPDRKILNKFPHFYVPCCSKYEGLQTEVRLFMDQEMRIQQ